MTAAVVGAWVPTVGSYGIRVAAGGSTQTVTLSVTIGRSYWLSGDGTLDSSAGDGDLMLIIANAIASHTSVGSCGVSLQQGRIRITSNVAISILWGDGLTTFDPTVLGFTGETTASATTTDAPNTCPFVWLPGAAISDDSTARPDPVEGRRTSISGLVRTTRFSLAAHRREVSFTLINQNRVLEDYAGSNRTAVDSLEKVSLSLGRRLRLYEDEGTMSSAAGFATYRLERPLDTTRSSSFRVRWDVRMFLRADGTDTRAAAADIWTPANGEYVRVSPGNYVALANPSTLNGRGTLTITMWMRNASASTDLLNIIARGTTLEIEERTAVGGGFGLRAIASEPGVGILGRATRDRPEIDDGNFHQWTFVINGTGGSLDIYIDGLAVTPTDAAGSAAIALDTNTSDLLIGSSVTTTRDIARLAIWGAAASAAQAAQIYAERRDLADGAGLSIGQPLIWMSLADLVVEGSVGGTASTVGSPPFQSGA